MEVATAQSRGARGQVDGDVTIVHHHGPEESVLADAGIEVGDLCSRRRPQTGIEDVNSNEGERRPPFMLVAAAEYALLEAHVVKPVFELSRHTGPSVALLALARYQGGSNRPLEVEDGARVSVITTHDRRKLHVRQYAREELGRGRDRLREPDARSGGLRRAGTQYSRACQGSESRRSGGRLEEPPPGPSMVVRVTVLRARVDRPHRS